MEGFHELVPAELISIFDAQELELLISGLPEIDLDDLRAHTDYHGYKSTDPTISNFWSALRAFSKEEKALFLQFVTGTSKVILNWCFAIVFNILFCDICTGSIGRIQGTPRRRWDQTIQHSQGIWGR